MSNNFRRITVDGQFPVEQQLAQTQVAQLVAVADEIDEQHEEGQIALLLHEVRELRRELLLVQAQQPPLRTEKLSPSQVAALREWVLAKLSLDRIKQVPSSLVDEAFRRGVLPMGHRSDVLADARKHTRSILDACRKTVCSLVRKQALLIGEATSPADIESSCLLVKARFSPGTSVSNSELGAFLVLAKRALIAEKSFFELSLNSNELSATPEALTSELDDLKAFAIGLRLHNLPRLIEGTLFLF